MTDLLMTLLQASGLYTLAMVFLSFGGFGWLVRAAHGIEARGPHLTTGSLLADGLLYYILVDFLSYWLHRLQHTKLLWWAHSFHHSARRLSPLTAQRRNPFDSILDPFAWSLPAALVMLHPVVAVAVSAFIAFTGKFLHSKIPWADGWFWRWVHASPSAHRIHHSFNPALFNRNFTGGLVIWDRLFLTWGGG